MVWLADRSFVQKFATWNHPCSCCNSYCQDSQLLIAASQGLLPVILSGIKRCDSPEIARQMHKVLWQLTRWPHIVRPHACDEIVQALPLAWDSLPVLFCTVWASLVPRTLIQRVHRLQYNARNTESNPHWGWFGSGTETKYERPSHIVAPFLSHSTRGVTVWR